MFRKITKREARKRYDENLPIHLIACKMKPGYPFNLGMTIFPSECKAVGQDFDAAIGEFSLYNCANDVGYYPAYYVEGKS